MVDGVRQSDAERLSAEFEHTLPSMQVQELIRSYFRDAISYNSATSVLKSLFGTALEMCKSIRFENMLLVLPSLLHRPVLTPDPHPHYPTRPPPPQSPPRRPLTHTPPLQSITLA
jgi:hypothetical protein